MRWSSPPLTTVSQPVVAMGRLAVLTVLRLVRGERIESTRVELATSLVVRDSTAPPDLDADGEVTDHEVGQRRPAG